MLDRPRFQSGLFNGRNDRQDCITVQKRFSCDGIIPEELAREMIRGVAVVCMENFAKRKTDPSAERKFLAAAKTWTAIARMGYNVPEMAGLEAADTAVSYHVHYHQHEVDKSNGESVNELPHRSAAADDPPAGDL